MKFRFIIMEKLNNEAPHIFTSQFSFDNYKDENGNQIEDI